MVVSLLTPGLTLVQACCKERDEITYPFSNINGKIHLSLIASFYPTFYLTCDCAFMLESKWTYGMLVNGASRYPMICHNNLWYCLYSCSQHWFGFTCYSLERLCSTLAWVMAYWLVAPNHNLNQCWLKFFGISSSAIIMQIHVYKLTHLMLEPEYSGVFFQSIPCLLMQWLLTSAGMILTIGCATCWVALWWIWSSYVEQTPRCDEKCECIFIYHKNNSTCQELIIGIIAFRRFIFNISICQASRQGIFRMEAFQWCLVAFSFKNSINRGTKC